MFTSGIKSSWLQSQVILLFSIFGSERSLRSADVVGLSVGQSALCSKALPKSSLGFLRVPKSS